MKRVQTVSMTVLVVVGLGIGYLATRNRQPPLVPGDSEHRGAQSQVPEGCLTCHGPDGVVPQSVNHPLPQDCLRCHGSG